MREAVADFEEIRPYRDDEVVAVLRRLSSDPSLLRDLSRYAAPSLSRWVPPIARRLVGGKLRRAFEKIDSVDAFQLALSTVFQRMIDDTTDGFTVSLDSTVILGGAPVRNDSRDLPPYGSGNVGREMMICLACGQVSSPKFCSVRMLS